MGRGARSTAPRPRFGGSESIGGIRRAVQDNGNYAQAERSGIEGK